MGSLNSTLMLQELCPMESLYTCQTQFDCHCYDDIIYYDLFWFILNIFKLIVD